jgi:hypothetical protein
MAHYSRFEDRFDAERITQIQGIRDYLSGRQVVYAILKVLQNHPPIENWPLCMFRRDEDKAHRNIPIVTEQGFDFLQNNLEQYGLKASLRHEWISVETPDNIAGLLSQFTDLEEAEKAQEIPRALHCLQSEEVQYFIYEQVRNSARPFHPRIDELLKKFDPEFEYSSRWIYGLTDAFIEFYRKQGYTVTQEHPWDFHFALSE